MKNINKKEVFNVMVESMKETARLLRKDGSIKLTGATATGVINAAIAIGCGAGVGKAVFSGIKWFAVEYLMNTIAFTAVDNVFEAKAAADAVDEAFSVNAEDVQTEN